MLKRNVTEKPNVNKFKMFQKYLRLPGFRGNLRKKKRYLEKEKSLGIHL